MLNTHTNSHSMTVQRRAGSVIMFFMTALLVSGLVSGTASAGSAANSSKHSTCKSWQNKPMLTFSSGVKSGKISYLGLAVLADDNKLVANLLENCVNPNGLAYAEPDDEPGVMANGHYPLAFAHTPQMAKLLLAHGADPNLLLAGGSSLSFILGWYAGDFREKTKYPEISDGGRNIYSNSLNGLKIYEDGKEVFVKTPPFAEWSNQFSADNIREVVKIVLPLMTPAAANSSTPMQPSFFVKTENVLFNSIKTADPELVTFVLKAPNVEHGSMTPGSSENVLARTINTCYLSKPEKEVIGRTILKNLTKGEALFMGMQKDYYQYSAFEYKTKLKLNLDVFGVLGPYYDRIGNIAYGGAQTPMGRCHHDAWKEFLQEQEQANTKPKTNPNTKPNTKLKQ